MRPWRAARYRLMVLTRSGRVDCRAHGSLIYLLRLGAAARSPYGRQWIELNYEPAVTVKYERTQRIIAPRSA